MSDLQYYQNQGFTREEAKSQVASDRASTMLIIRLFSLVFKIFLAFFLFLPGIICAYFILHGVRSYLGPQTVWSYFLWWAGMVYVLECLVFLLKGLMVSLRENE